MSRLNILAERYKKDSNVIVDIMNLIKPLKNALRKKFLYSDVERIDFNSTCDFALLKALRTYSIDKGNFDYHFFRWAREEVKREIIRNKDFRLPYWVAVKYYKITGEDRFLPETCENRKLLTTKYGLTSNEYKAIKLYEKHYVIISNVSAEEAEEINEDIEDLYIALESLPAKEQYVLAHYYGTSGYVKKSLKEIGIDLDVSTNIVKKLLDKGINRLRNILGE